MKGTSFQKPLEFNLDVSGESWCPGENVHGSLRVKNHGSEAVPLDDVQIQLVLGHLKRVQQKLENAFADKPQGVFSVESASGKRAPLEPGGEAVFPWAFKTDRNAPITDPSNSLFLLYGRCAERGPGRENESVGQLQLIFHPGELIRKIIDVFKIQFRFVVKTQRGAKKGAIEIKMVPPEGSKAFATLEHVIAGFHFKEDETLVLTYSFHLKKLEANAATLSATTVKGKESLVQSFSAQQCKMPEGRFNHELFELAIGEALATVQAKNHVL